MKTMNIYPFDTNRTSTTCPAVTHICLDVYYNTFLTTADTDDKLNHHHVHRCKNARDYLFQTRTTSTFKDLHSSETKKCQR